MEELFGNQEYRSRQQDAIPQAPVLNRGWKWTMGKTVGLALNGDRLLAEEYRSVLDEALGKVKQD
jgi:hypothetical protein